MTEKRYSILIAEDEEEIRENVQIHLQFKGFETYTAANGIEALAAVEKKTPDLILSDMVMPQMDGLQLLHALSQKNIDIPVIIVTAYGNMESAINSLKNGAAEFLTKPIDLEYMVKVIHKVIERHELKHRVREQQEQMECIINNALDAIVVFDQHFHITLLNPAAYQMISVFPGESIEMDMDSLLSNESYSKLAALVEHLKPQSDCKDDLWIPNGLQVVKKDGGIVNTEASLSSFIRRSHPYYLLILRDIEQRLEAERKIQSLSNESEYLKEEIKTLHNTDEIIGHSEALQQVLLDVKQVADTDATVLILGETGTGKELFARAIHTASKRSNKPLIKVNCAAIPSTLIESEFFGHEKGAFTGATQKRDGRFTLANGGTIFLDEVGELPLDLQSKLLRVLQEGEFEPVGSSKTKKVDVRVISATNQDLYQSVQDGTFREDLYYRLNVFPINLPPLRERGEDIVLLAAAFAYRFAKKIGRPIKPLSENSKLRLQAYDWPGNIRELQNVIERAVITARDNQLNLDRALPETASVPIEYPATVEEKSIRILTVDDMQRLERENITKALEAANWQVSGENGAAELLGMNPSTLSSRIKTLGIKRQD